MCVTVCSEMCYVTVEGGGRRAGIGRKGGRRREGVGVQLKVRLKHPPKRQARAPAQPTQASDPPQSLSLPVTLQALLPSQSHSLCSLSFFLCWCSLTLFTAAGWRRGRNGTSPTAQLIETPTETYRAVENSSQPSRDRRSSTSFLPYEKGGVQSMSQLVRIFCRCSTFSFVVAEGLLLHAGEKQGRQQSPRGKNFRAIERKLQVTPVWTQDWGFRSDPSGRSLSDRVPLSSPRSPLSPLLVSFSSPLSRIMVAETYVLATCPRSTELVPLTVLLALSFFVRASVGWMTDPSQCLLVSPPLQPRPRIGPTASQKTLRVRADILDSRCFAFVLLLSATCSGPSPPTPRTSSRRLTERSACHTPPRVHLLVHAR